MTHLGLIPEETLAVLCDVNALAAVVREVSLAVNRLEIALAQKTARDLPALRDWRQANRSPDLTPLCRDRPLYPLYSPHRPLSGHSLL